MPALADDLSWLVEELRARDFPVAVDQCLAAEKVLLALSAEGRAESANKARWLAPVFCTSPQSQEEFYRIYRELTARKERDKPDRLLPGTPGKELSSRDSEKAVRRRKLPSWTAMAAAIVALLVAALVFAYQALRPQLTDRVLTGRTLDTGEKPVVGAKVGLGDQVIVTAASGTFALHYRDIQLPAFIGVFHQGYEPTSVPIDRSTSRTPVVVHLKPRPPQDGKSITQTYEPLQQPTLPPAIEMTAHYLPLLRAAASALPLLIVAAWWFWRYFPRLYLGRFAGRLHARIESIRVAEGADRAVQSGAFRRASQNLQGRRESETHEVDVERSLDATMRNGGWFTPVMARRKLLPEYLALIDRTNLRDQQARFEDEVVRGLQKSGVFIQRYFFHGEPRACWDDTDHRALTLEELSGKHPGHSLLVFGDASSFFNSLAGEPAPWLPQLDAWSERAVLATAGFEYATALTDHGFRVAPATVDALASIGNEAGWSPTVKDSYPILLRQEPLRWLDRLAPVRALVERLMLQLRRYLGEEGFYWLSACAVYPELHWELSLYLGYALVGREIVQASLPNLVRLPWFRYGDMPEWLRQHLIASLAAERERAVRNALESLLANVVEHGAGLELEVGAKASSPRPLCRWKRRLLLNYLRAEPAGSPLRDVVFLSFLSRKQPKQLFVEAPRPWWAVLPWRWRLRGWGLPVRFATAALAGIAIWWGTGKVPVVGPLEPLTQILPRAVPPSFWASKPIEKAASAKGKTGNPFYSRTEPPWGVVLATVGGATIQRAGIESSLTARAGDFLFPGDKVSADRGTLDVLDCQTSEVTRYILSDKKLVRKVQFCEFPSVERWMPPVPSSSRVGPQANLAAAVQSLPAPGKARITQMSAVLANNPEDFATLMSRGATLERYGFYPEAIADYQLLNKAWSSPQLTSVINNLEWEAAANLAPVQRGPGKTYALVVGISKYQRIRIQNRPYGAQDADLFAAYLRSPRGGAVPTEDIWLLNDDQATAAGIRNRLYAIAAATEASDNLIFYISLAASEQSTDFLMAFDSDEQDPEATGISTSDFARILTSVRAGKLFLYMDTPYSRAYDGLRTDKNIDALFATNISKRNFGYDLLSGLMGPADTDKDGNITFGEIASYVKQRLYYQDGVIPVTILGSPDIVVADTSKPGITLPLRKAQGK